MTTIMLDSSIHPPASFCPQRSCKWWRLWRLHIVGQGNRGEGTKKVNVRKLGYIDNKVVYGPRCSKLPAEWAGMWMRYTIHRSENKCCSGSEIERPQSLWIQLCIYTTEMLGVKIDYIIMWTKLETIQQQVEHVWSERQLSINDFRSVK